jgi:hypothetical protein
MQHAMTRDEIGRFVPEAERAEAPSMLVVRSRAELCYVGPEETKVEEERKKIRNYAT